MIGIGAGNPGHVTAEAAAAIARADVVLAMDKGDDKADLLALRHEILARYGSRRHRLVSPPDPARHLDGPHYAGAVAGWHDERVAIYERLLADEVANDEVGAFLVWGDPSLYDSTLRILDQVAERGVVAPDVEVVPGISSVSVLAARHRIALNQVGRPVLVTTGRRLREAGALPEGVDDVVVMLDGSCSFTAVDPAGIDIYWGAYLGAPDEILVAGPLAERAAEIERVRAEARERKGWMFDTYLLRRRVEERPSAGALGR